MKIVEALIVLLAGMGVFLFGMQTMSSGLEKSASKKIRKLFSKISNNRFAGIGIGATSTAIIQSSSAVTVMTVGFVNAGIISLFQAATIIMGANIGTSISSVLFAMKDLPISVFFMLLSFIGLLMISTGKNSNLSKIGEILMGLGLVFVGLNFMSDGFKTPEISRLLSNLFIKVSNPFALILFSIIITAMVQSSSLVTAITIGIMGIIEPISGFYIIMGTNIGTCFTAIIASIGTNSNAKRTAFIHIFFNFVGVIVLLAFLLSFEQSFTKFFAIISGGKPEWQIAYFNVFFNVGANILFLPFVKQLVWIANKVIKERSIAVEKRFKYLDERILNSPAIAIEQVLKEIIAMSELAQLNLDLAMSDLFENTGQNLKEFIKNEDQLNFLNREISTFMVKISNKEITFSDEALLGTLYHVVSDIERIGDHAENLSDAAQLMQNDSIVFSSEAISEVNSMYEKVKELFNVSKRAFKNRDVSLIASVEAIEQEIDDMKISFADAHITRLHSGSCSVESGAVFYEITTNLERVADHLTNIAYSIRSYKKKMAISSPRASRKSNKNKPKQA